MKRIIQQTSLFLIVLPLTVFAQNRLSSNVLITIQKENVTISEILKEIEKQTGYFLVFSKEDLDINQIVTLQVKNEKPAVALSRFFSPLHITYNIRENYIILKKQVNEKEDDTKKVQPPAPQKNIAKTNVENEATRSEEKRIDEVVVIGYGTRKRLNVIGSMASVEGNRLVRAHQADLSNSIAGNLPGLRSIQKSGRPGYDGSIIDIRGYGDDILTIVDGVERPFSQIDPNEIESISILKDASAAVFGFKSANGVLLITTKKGEATPPRVSYNFNRAFQSITRYPEYMNVRDYMNSYNEARSNLAHLGQTPSFTPDDIAKAQNTDWQKAVLKDYAPMQQHNVNVLGGNEMTKYFISLGYLNQDGILRTKDHFQRYNFRSNLNMQISKRLTAEMQISGRREIRDAPATVSGGGSSDNFSQSIFKNMAMALPYKTIYANNDPLYYNDLGSEPNPVALLNRDRVGSDRKQYDEVNGQLIINYEVPFVKGLSLKALAAYDKQTDNQSIFKKAFSEYTYCPPENTFVPNPVNQTTSKREKFQQNDIVNQQYSVSYGNESEKYKVSGLFLWEIRRSNHSEHSASGEFNVSSVSELAAAEKNRMVDGASRQSANMGFIGHLNYMYDNKYLLELSFRKDGVSKFAKAGRWVFTSGISTGWRISEEKFFKNLTGIFNNLKLRASYGKFPLAGALSEIYFLSGYNYPGRDASGLPVYFIQGENNPVLVAGDRGIINPDLTWEKVSIANLGIDASFWNGKFYAEWDGFYRRHTGMYFTRNLTLPTSFGATLPDENLNSESDRGMEWVLGSKQKINELYFDIKASFSYARKKREYQELPDAGNQYTYWQNRYQESNGRVSKNPYRWDNITWGYEALGQFQNYAEILQSPIQDGQGNTTLLPGDIKYRDVNEDRLINDLDLLPIGRSDRPEIFFGLNFSAVWKNLDATVFFQGAANYTYTFNYRDPFVQGGTGNGYVMYKDRWRRADVNDPNSAWIAGYFPPLRVESYAGNQAPSTFWSKNTAYLRLKTIDCGYTLPHTITAKAGIQKLRIYINTYNLWTLSREDLKYVDPEGETGYGIYYPQMKSVGFGVNIEF
ncbi:MAG: SusC/RagA family TonB-linked outer membrane protein [Candidatus Symbiothrix sp.]|jgi:TonB-linked SusC/RagA family outer membrane protein|nr:SusC/RagA family TonB-linked outer membrane protein [Candidatus Symbiothrix sp.]